MKIKNIQMEGYKRFFNLTIDLGSAPKRIIALVGPNGCGKSSVFDAMLYVDQAYNGARRSKDYKYHSLNQSSNYDYKKIKIKFDKGDDFWNVREQYRCIGKENTIFSFRSAYRYNSNLKLTKSEAVEDIALNREGAGTASDLDDRMEKNYRRVYSNVMKLLKENREEYTLAKAESEIIGNLNKSLKECLNLEINNLGDIDADKGTIYFKKDDSSIAFEYNVLSSGEKEVVDLLIDLYLRKDIYTDSIYIIDEPELHINTSIQRKLMLEINKIIPKDCQIWIATHSIGIIRCLQEDLKQETQIVEFEEGKRWASEKYILEPIRMSRNKWKELFSIALDDLTNLIVPKCFIYCEGKDLPDSKGKQLVLMRESIILFLKENIQRYYLFQVEVIQN